MKQSLLSLVIFGTVLSACGGASGGGVSTKILGVDHVNGLSANLPWVDDDMNNDPNHLTLAVRFVNYVSNGQSVLSKSESQRVVNEINQLYSACNVHLRVEDYQEVVPETRGLKFNPSTMAELQTIRSTFDDEKYLVLTNTGEWNHSGGLGADGANAWTAMPGTNPSGAVVEAKVAATASIAAHELGHYLNLDHFGSQTNLMNPVVYENSTALTTDQCQQMRQAALTVRQGALRS